jgi:uncharacterized membrane protein
MGLVAGVLITLAAGLLANLFLVRWLLNLMERILDRIPLVKSLFQGLKDISRFLEQGSNGQMGRPVSVELPLADGDIRLVGFVMQEQARLPRAPGSGDDDDDASPRRMAVFLPMSYQMGGYTLYVDPALVRPLDVSPEQAMRAALTGGALASGRAQAGSDAGTGQQRRAPRDEREHRADGD